MVNEVLDYSNKTSLSEVLKGYEDSRRLELLNSIKEILPNKLSNSNREAIANEIIDGLDNGIEDSIKEQYKDNLITYSSVIATGSKVRVDDYLTAVKYVTYRNAGLTVKDSYCLAKAKEVQLAKLEGLTDEKLINRANAYAQNKIVKEIQNSNQMPLHIVFGDALVDGIRRMHDIILHGNDRNAIGAFDSLARAIMPKEDTEVKIDTSVLEDKLDQIQKAKLEFSHMVIDNIKDGNITIKDILNKTNKRDESLIAIDGEVIDVE